MAKAVCPVCGTEFEKLQGNRTKDYCSEKCRKKAWNQKQKELKKQNPRMIKCAICGKEFHPTHARQKVCTDVHTRPCEVCGKPVPYKRPNEYDRARTCSEECRRELQRRTNVDRRGVSYPMQSAEVRKNHEAAMLSAHGVTHALQSEEFKEKAKQTAREHFGTDWALQSPEVQDKRKSTMLERYGVEHPFEMESFREKSRETCIRKYGVDNPSKSPAIRKKAESTILARYKVKHPSQCAAIARKIKETRLSHHGQYWTAEMQDKFARTCQERYGADNPFASDAIKRKIRETCLSKYGVPHAFQSPEVRARMIATTERRYGVPYYILTDTCKKSCAFVRISDINKQWKKKLESIGYEVELEKTIGTKSYDLHLVGYNILIEINPTYTHSLIPPHYRKDDFPIDYHIEKTKIANSAGFRCIHVFDWDDKSKILDILSMNKQPVYARKCELRAIDHKEADAFEDLYHLQGKCRGQTCCYGLYYNNDLVSVMTFGAPRWNRAYEYELLRLCSRSDIKVIGGAERMLKRFIQDHHPKSIISYCDISKFSGDVYTRIGFTRLKDTEPNLVWSKGKKHITNNLLMHRGFDQLFNTNYGKGTSNNELMIQHGWKPVYDCGQMVFEMRFGD